MLGLMFRMGLRLLGSRGGVAEGGWLGLFGGYGVFLSGTVGSFLSRM